MLNIMYVCVCLCLFVSVFVSLSETTNKHCLYLAVDAGAAVATVEFDAGSVPS